MIITKCWIFLQVLLFIHIGLPASDIIYLKGTCSAGKSTLIRTLDDSYEIVDEDAIMHRSYVDAVAIRFPEAFQVIQQFIAKENLYHALREKDVLFKNSESQEALDALKTIQDELNQDLPWRLAVSRGIDEEVLRKVKDAVQQNKNVVLDSWYITPDRLALECPDAHIIKVLLYCPLDRAYKRFLKRNAEAHEQKNLTEKRYLRQLIGSFISLYQISSDPSQSIQKITKMDLDPIFEEMAKGLSGSAPYKKTVFTFETLSKGYFLEMKEGFLHPFNDSKEELYLSPKEQYDIILTT